MPVQVATSEIKISSFQNILYIPYIQYKQTLTYC